MPEPTILAESLINEALFNSQPEFAGKTIVTVLPDAAERYLTSSLFEGMFDD